VLCITHLPQIAAFADSHYKITKQVEGDRTRTEVGELEGETREQEIAAMLGGTPVSPAALENARQILRETEKLKSGRKKAKSRQLSAVSGQL
jgi:DNA repair protein RecN (Recombination protein N)